MSSGGPLIETAQSEIQRMDSERQSEAQRRERADYKVRKEALKRQKLAREEDEQAKFEQNRVREEQKREIDERIAAKKSIANFYTPNMPNEGLMSKVEYQTQLTPEGMAGAILAEFFVLAVKLLFNTDFMKQSAEYEQLKKAGMFHLIYEPDENGEYPKVYRVDPASGEIDYDEVVPAGEASHFEIRMNGLVPIPNWTQGMLAACDQYMGGIMGQGGLTAEQKVRAYGVLEAADGAMSKHNVARDRAAMAAMRPPKPS